MDSMSVETESSDNTDQIRAGEWAIDDDAAPEDREPLLVLERTGTDASNHVIFQTPAADDDITVASENPNHGADEEVVVVAYLSSLERSLDDWDIDRVLSMYRADELEDSGVRTYSFPAGRIFDASA